MNDVNSLIDKKTYISTDYAYRLFLNKLRPQGGPGLSIPKTCSIKDVGAGINNVIIHSIASCISTCYENINMSEAEELDTYFSKISSFDSIECLEEMNTKEKCQQIRNCFAHGHYKGIRNDQTGLDGIRINNGKIRGIITIEDLIELKKVFVHLATATGPSKLKKIYLVSSINKSLKNRAILRRELDKFEYYQISASKGENNYKETLDKISKRKINFIEAYKIITVLKKLQKSALNHFDFEARKLTEEEKKWVMDIFNNIKYNSVIDLNDQFPDYIKSLLLEIIRDIISRNNMHIHNVDIHLLMKSLGIGNQGESQTVADNLFQLRYLIESPFTTAKILLQYSFFTFDYLREMNERNQSALFQYKDFNMKGIDYKSYNGEKIVRRINPKEKLKEELNRTRNRIERLTQAINSSEKRKNNLEKGKDKIPGIDKKLEEINSKLEQIKQELKKEKLVLLEIANIVSSIPEEPYIDCRHLFRHLRNSIAHRGYSVDYSDAISMLDFGRIKYHFEDYDNVYDEQGNIIDKKLVFTMDCDGKTLERFLKDINARVVNMLDSEKSIDEEELEHSQADKIIIIKG